MAALIALPVHWIPTLVFSTWAHWLALGPRLLNSSCEADGGGVGTVGTGSGVVHGSAGGWRRRCDGQLLKKWSGLKGTKPQARQALTMVPFFMASTQAVVMFLTNNLCAPRFSLLRILACCSLWKNVFTGLKTRHVAGGNNNLNS